jgi:hypothetical protein
MSHRVAVSILLTSLSPHGFLTRSKRSRSISGRTGPKFGVDIDNT